MSQFEEFNAENKLRIPLSAYAAQMIENDCYNFFKKKTTLINAIILNSYQKADCSISLRLREYKDELTGCLESFRSKEKAEMVERALEGKAEKLVQKYAKRYPSDVNWQITLSKKAKELLTEDPTSMEEHYYGQRPGHFVRALLEEYARHPYYKREKIVFKNIFDSASMAIDGQYILHVTTEGGIHFSLKPYCIKTDPLFMYHYLVGYNMNYDETPPQEAEDPASEVLGLRISRLIDAQPQYLSSGKLTEKEQSVLSKELTSKGIQFLKSPTSRIRVRLSDLGIQKYKSQAHLRPPVSYIEEADDHIYHFECTEYQILLYFFKFGKDAEILSPSSLREKFTTNYKEAYELYLRKR